MEEERTWSCCLKMKTKMRVISALIGRRFFLSLCCCFRFWFSLSVQILVCTFFLLLRLWFFEMTKPLCSPPLRLSLRPLVLFFFLFLCFVFVGLVSVFLLLMFVLCNLSLQSFPPLCFFLSGAADARALAGSAALCFFFILPVPLCFFFCFSFCPLPPLFSYSFVLPPSLSPSPSPLSSWFFSSLCRPFFSSTGCSTSSGFYSQRMQGFSFAGTE